MVKPLVIDHNDTVRLENISILVEGSNTDRVTFIHGGRDVIQVAASAGDVHINLKRTVGATIIDETSGLHLKLDSYSIGITIDNFQNDPCAKIDLVRSPFQNLDDLAAHLKVTPEGTTLLSTIPHGPPIVSFQGDFNVNPNQFVLHC